MPPCRPVLLAVVSAVVLTSVCSASEGGLAPWHLRAAWEEAYNDNVRQSDGPDTDADVISALGLAVEWDNPKKHSRLPRAARLGVDGYVYANVSDFNYVEIHPELTYPLPWRVDMELEYVFSPRRLLYDEGGTARPVFYQENELTGTLVRRFGAERRLRAALGCVNQWDDYRDASNPRDSWTPGVVADGRYRLDVPSDFLTAIIPRLTVEYGVRHARRENFDRDELTLSPGIELQGWHGVSARFRYERSMRDYTVGEPNEASGPRNNNFDREDDINEYQTWLMVPLAFAPGLALGARYRFREGDYDVPNRKVIASDGSTVIGEVERFDVHEVGLGLVYRF